MISDPHNEVVPNVGEAASARTPAESESHALHPLSIITTGLRYLRGLVLPIGIVIVTRGFSGDRVQNAFTFGIPIVAGLLAILYSAVHWMLFRYQLTNRELIIRSGVISRQERVVPLERIQSVDFDEAPLERVLGLVRVRVETAASGSSEAKIELNSLGQADAQALRDQLLAARARVTAPHTSPADGADPVPTPERAVLDAGEVIARLSTRDLLLAGATSGRIGPAAALLGITAQFGTEYIPRSLWNRVPWDSAADAGLQVILAAIIIVGFIAWGLAIVSTILTYGGFELRRRDEQLVIQYGLLDRKRRTIPMRRIQAVVVIEGLLRQPFGFAEIRFESAGRAGGNEEGSSGVLMPFLRTRDVQGVIDAAAPEFTLPALVERPMQRLPDRALPRYVVPNVVWTFAFCLLVNLVFWRWIDGIRWWTLAIVILLPIMSSLAWWQYRTAGWQATPVHLLMRWRSLTGRCTMITRRQRLQHRSLTSNPFQRRASLVTFHAAVASGGSGGHFSLPHLDRHDAELLLADLQPTRTSLAPNPAMGGSNGSA